MTNSNSPSDGKDLETDCLALRSVGRTAAQRDEARSLRRRHRFESLEDRHVMSATFGSALSIGGNGSEGVFDVETDDAGYSYVTGDFEGTVDFDLTGSLPGDADILTAAGSRDALSAEIRAGRLSRLGSPHGRRCRAKQRRQRRGTQVCARRCWATCTSSANSLNSADFGSTTLTSAGSADAFVAKFTSTGNLTWAKRWGTADHNAPHGLGVDANGNVYIVSHTYGRGYDIVKFNSNGAQSWSQLVAANPGVTARLAVSPSGNVYVAGVFQGTVDFDPSSKVKSVSTGPSQAYADVCAELGHERQVQVGDALCQQDGRFDVGLLYGQFRLARQHRQYLRRRALPRTPWTSTPGPARRRSIPPEERILPSSIARVVSFGRERSRVGRGPMWSRSMSTRPETSTLPATSSSSIDLNPNAGVDVRSSAGNQDIFVVKLTASGNYVWGETFGGSGNATSPSASPSTVPATSTSPATFPMKSISIQVRSAAEHAGDSRRLAKWIAFGCGESSCIGSSIRPLLIHKFTNRMMISESHK